MPGEMLEGWRTSELADIAKLSMGETLLSKNLTGDGIPVFSANTDDGPWGFTSNNRRRLRRGDIVVGARGSIGFPRRPDFDAFTCTQTTIAVEPDRDVVDSEYLHHALCATDILGIASQQAVPMLTIGSLSPLEVALPPLDEQRRIAEVLRSVDEAIAAAEQAANKARRLLANLGREIMQSPDEEPINGSETLRLLDVCRPKQHLIIGKADLTPEGYPVYGANGQIGFAQSFTHAEPVIAITCRGATCGTVNWVPAKSYVTGNAMALDHLDRERVHERFLFHYVSVWGVARSISGSAQPQITRQSLSCIDIIAPDVSRQAEIANALDAIEMEAIAAEDALGKARNLKAALMSDLLSGRVRVPA